MARQVNFAAAEMAVKADQIQKIMKNPLSAVFSMFRSAWGAVSRRTTLRNLSVSNIDSVHFPWGDKTPRPGPGAGITKRWEIPIPVKTNGDQRASDAMDRIEKELGLEQPLFDRQSIADKKEALIMRGLIVRTGTAYVAPKATDYKKWRGNVSCGPKKPDYPSDFFDASTGVICTRLYINLDNDHVKATTEDTIHEFGHALGFGDHFRGFGDGPPISPAFWAALKTLYHNEPGTLKANVEVLCSNGKPG